MVELNLFYGTSNVIGESKNLMSIEQVAIDDILLKETHVDLIKIDVDGYEKNVLEGARKVIKKFKPIMIVELNDDIEIIEFFRKEGYYIYDLSLSEIDMKNLPPNIISLPTKINVN